MKVKILTIIKHILILPFWIAISPFILVVMIWMFFVTDWEEEREREATISAYKKIISLGFWE